MRVYLGFVGRRGPIPAAVLDEIVERLTPFLPFAGAVAHAWRWTAPGDRVALLSWTNEQGAPGTGATSAGVLSGYVAGSVDAAGFLAGLAAASERDGVIAGAGGIFSAAIAEPDRIVAWTQLTRIEPVYWAEGTDVAAVGNRALLVHLAATGRDRPDYDLDALAPFLNMGFYASDGTPFRGVGVVAPNHRLEVGGGGARTAPVDGAHDLVGREPLDASLMDAMAEALIRDVGALRRADVPIVCDVTGGKDSRLVAAALAAAGISFEARTTGFEHDPDVAVAGQIARTLDVGHQVTPRARVDEGAVSIDVLGRTCETLVAGDGMLSAYENVATPRTFGAATIRLGGHGGEVVRGGYANHVAGPPALYARFFFRGILQTAWRYAMPEPMALYRRSIHAWRAAQPSEADALDLLDRFYLRFRCGRWSAAARGAYTRALPLHTPLLGDEFVRLSRRVACVHRAREELRAAVLARLDPRLASLPAPTARPAAAGEAGASNPLPSAPAGRRPADWRLGRDPALARAMREHILDAAPDALFAVVRRRPVERLLSSSDRLDDPLLAWRIYTTSVLLSNEWLRVAHPERVVSLRVGESGTGRLDRARSAFRAAVAAAHPRA